MSPYGTQSILHDKHLTAVLDSKERKTSAWYLLFVRTQSPTGIFVLKVQQYFLQYIVFNDCTESTQNKIVIHSASKTEKTNQTEDWWELWRS